MILDTCIFDTETMGLHGPMVILQYQFDDDDSPVLYNPWLEPVSKTILLIRRMVASRVVAHNITFDWAKIQSFYNAIVALAKSQGLEARPIDHLNEMVDLIYSERSAYCLKPKQAVCTLMLCQKQVGGAALAMKEIRVRKVPTVAAETVAYVLNKNTNIPEIMFANRKQNKDIPWTIAEHDDGPEWSDVLLKFAPSNRLKDIAKLVLGVEAVQKLGTDLRPDEYPAEEGYAPYCNLLDEGGYWYTPKPKGKAQPVARKLWPLLLHDHINFWNNDPQAVKYALDDIVLLKMLFEHLGSPETDFDSEVGCQVASVRMAGFDIDKARLAEGMLESQAEVDKAEINVDSPKQVKGYILDALDELEAFVVAEGCARKKLDHIINIFTLEKEEECECDESTHCLRCNSRRYVGPGPMPVVDRANHILNVRNHRKRLQLYRKLDKAQAAYPSFKVIGTKSGRMAGADGLNWHGVDSSQSIREIMSMVEDHGANPDWVVSGGDFDSQELSIMAATMKDEALSDDIRTGKSLHAVFAEAASGIPYDQIMANKSKDGPESVIYGKAKACVYALSYGAAEHKIAETIGCTESEAGEIMQKFFEKYVHMLQCRKQVTENLSCLLRTDEGRLEIRRPKQTHIDSCFGFRRAFNVEYAVIGSLVEAMADLGSRLNPHTKAACLASKQSELYEEWKRQRVIRKDEKGEQTIGGAISSALYGATFSVQNKIIRAALNHQIQSAGRTITLRCQKAAWDAGQPCGIHPFAMKIMSVHDELVCTSTVETAEVVQDAVEVEIDILCKEIPLLGLEWNIDVGSWYGIKSAKGGRGMGFSRNAVAK